MRGFHQDFSKLPNIPIATVASTHRGHDGTKSILIMNEVLYFGGKLDQSLINPNQIRHYGIAVSDNPYDVDKSLGIDHEQDFIPFELEGGTVYFETTYPTMDEIEMHPHLVLTDGGVPWDPTGVNMNADRPYGGPMYDDMRMIRQVQVRRLHAPIECESDLHLGSISTTLVPNQAYERMVARVRVLPRRDLVKVIKSDGGNAGELLVRSSPTIDTPS